MQTVDVALTTGAYVALSSGADYAQEIYIRRGCRIRLKLVAGGVPAGGATGYLLIEGPTTSDKPGFQFTLPSGAVDATDEAYARADSGSCTIQVFR